MGVFAELFHGDGARHIFAREVFAMVPDSKSQGRAEAAETLLAGQHRRHFVKTLIVGGLTWSSGLRTVCGEEGGERDRFKAILVDYAKCTGCRTCETVCAQQSTRTSIDGEMIWGLGNPRSANIRVLHFNPDVDVPVVCVMCEDSPCITACPVEPDGRGRRALYRDPQTHAIKNDADRCLTCGKCSDTCQDERVGAIVPNPRTGHPERMCTLCDGDPQCVRYCPYDALTIGPSPFGEANPAPSADALAEDLAGRWYAYAQSEEELP